MKVVYRPNLVTTGFVQFLRSDEATEGRFRNAFSSVLVSWDIEDVPVHGEDLSDEERLEIERTTDGADREEALLRARFRAWDRLPLAFIQDVVGRVTGIGRVPESRGGSSGGGS